MANRLFNPDIQYFGTDGTTPLSGGKLFFYTTGTSTKLNTYSDSGLTIANTNPVILDSAGRAGPIFLQNLQYKIVLSPSTDTDPPTSPIWTQDPVYTSDVSTQAQLFSGSGNPNGNVAGTQGSATTLASEYWDYTNDILYVCTLTGNAASAVWTAVNPASSSSVVPSPQGYITPVSGTPIITSDSIAATTVYYTPYVGTLVPVYNGTSFVPTSIVSELQYTLTSNLAASNIYDLFIFNNSGVATFGSGPSWSAGSGGSITAGSCARGTGVGGAALSRLNGIMTNAVSMTIRYGTGTTTAVVAANQATYVGSLFMDGTNGQVTCHRSFGQSRKWGIWNAYNRAPIILQAGDSTASWGYASATIRQSNAAAGNTLAIFSGLAEEEFNISFNQFVLGGGVAATIGIAIGLNSTTAISGKDGVMTAQGTSTFTNELLAQLIQSPSLGINNINCLEFGASSGSITFNGTQTHMLLKAWWRG